MQQHVRVDLTADFLGIEGMKNNMSYFYSGFKFTPYENGDVMIGSSSQPRLVMIPVETQTDAFKAALKRKLATLPPPHFKVAHPLGSDTLLSKMAPKVITLEKYEYIRWSIQRSTHHLCHGLNNMMCVPCLKHLREYPCDDLPVETKSKKKKRKKKKKGKGGNATASTEAGGESGVTTDLDPSTPPSSRATSGWSTIPNTPTDTWR
ncbi:hypothetical protein CJU90_6436 [Yarrowia sp. C11]|nr:hypothetical protein CJU90_6436 [Yarrowia sp. C11]KAG5371136.1 hypothetical protein CKK34_1276 [Yarrowia sp. E02]